MSATLSAEAKTHFHLYEQSCLTKNKKVKATFVYQVFLSSSSAEAYEGHRILDAPTLSHTRELILISHLGRHQNNLFLFSTF